MTNDTYKLLPKLSLKEICGLKRSVPADQTKEYFRKLAENDTQIAIIAGDVEGYGQVATQFKESTYLTGMFIARNELEGTMFRSNKLFLPKGAAEQIVARFNARTTGEDRVKFQLCVRVIKDEGSATGYQYICEAVRTPEIINREAELMATFDALPAPKPVAKLANNSKK